MAKTRAQSNRAIRQEELREFLSKQKLIEKVLDNIKKMEELKVVVTDGNSQLDGTFELNKLKSANSDRIKLINKYLPDLKSAEVTGPDGGAIEFKKVEELSDEELALIAAGRG